MKGHYYLLYGMRANQLNKISLDLAGNRSLFSIPADHVTDMLSKKHSYLQLIVITIAVIVQSLNFRCFLILLLFIPLKFLKLREKILSLCNTPALVWSFEHYNLYPKCWKVITTSISLCVPLLKHKSESWNAPEGKNSGKFRDSD